MAHLEDDRRDRWRTVWREGVAPLLTRPQLLALADALRRDDERLVQGGTTVPPPLIATADWPCQGACAIAYAGWRGSGLTTVAEVEEFFGGMCFKIDQRIGEAAGCRWFLNWFDETPRDAMRAELLPEVELALASLPLEAP